MEETFGKRIVLNRKRLGLTQDALAEQLGVTAQAVSKWENDQSCPDITMLPKLAEVFGITTDELLGLPKKEVHIAEGIPVNTESDTDEPQGIHMESKKGTWEFRWDGGRKSGVGLGVWVLLVGGLLLFAELTGESIGLLNFLWPSALLVFGLFGIYPKFSVFRFGCAMFGAYCLLGMFDAAPFGLEIGILLPLFLLLAGLHLVLNAFRKPKHGQFQVSHNGKSISDPTRNYCTYDKESFDCATSFGENRHLIQLPRLSAGSASVSFGEMTVDLSGCGELTGDCRLELNCAFGELEILVPRRWKVMPVTSTTFASVETEGAPNADAEAVLGLDCSVSFGEITIHYI